MTAWAFPSAEALLAAIAGLSEAALSRPIRHGRVGGTVVVEAEAPGLRAFATPVAAPPDLRPGAWAEAVGLVRRADLDVAATVLFVVPPGCDADLPGEMLRLGHHRQELAELSDGTLLLRVAGPPYYSVLKALDGGPIRGFVPAGRVWVQIGWEHPLAARIQSEGLTLIAPEGWRHVPDGPWVALEHTLDLHVQAPVLEVATPPTRRLSVPLRLARAPARAPSLWISDDVTAMDAAITAMPESVVSSLNVAVLLNPERVVLSLRPGRAIPELPGSAFVLHDVIVGLYLPVGTAIDPPIRPARLQALLSPPAGHLAWAEMRGDTLALHTVAADALVPLERWVDYLLDRDAEHTLAWLASGRFNFEGLREAQGPAPKAPPGRRAAERAQAPSTTAPDVEPQPIAAPAPPSPRARPAAIRLDLTPDDAAKAVSSAEQRFLASPLSADAPERVALWAELGALYGAVGRARDAGLAWARAIWSGQAEEQHAFAEAMAHAHGPPASLLTLAEPSREHTRAVAAALLADALSASQARTLLAAHAHQLDLRTFWLVNVKLARSAGGDPLGLARARDHMFAALANGLPVSRELPAFLRFAGLGNVSQVGNPLVAMHSRFFAIKRSRHPLEVSVETSAVYVGLIFAWGYARLGLVDRAHEARATALEGLKHPDAIHRFCSQGLAARIAQALEGEPATAPLPAALMVQQNGFTDKQTYVVNRFRQACRILEPSDRFDAIQAFAEGQADPRRAVFGELRGMADARARAARLSAILVESRAVPEPEAAKRVDGVLDFLTTLPPESLGPVFDQALARAAALPPGQTVALLAKALDVASRARDAERFGQAWTLTERTYAAVAAGPESGRASVCGALPELLRSLRRMGDLPRAADLLDALMKAPPSGLPDRIALATAMLAQGRPELATPIFDEAWRRLSVSAPTPLLERLALCRALARTSAFSSPEQALDTASQMFLGLRAITDGLSTNEWFAISLVEFAECLVTTLAHDDLILGDRGRAVVDDEEYVLRQRVHRDLVG